MKKVNEKVQRLTPHCIGDDCAQVIIPYKYSLTHLNKDGILYHHIPRSDLHINKYLEDERRKQFPYSNIPTHRARVGYHKLNYTNQIFNFDEPYISIGDGHIVESYVVKDDSSALMIKKILKENERITHMTRIELDKLFQKSANEEEQLYVLNVAGGFYKYDYSITIPSEENILNTAKGQLIKNLEEYKRVILNSKNYYPTPFNEFDVEILQNCINSMKSDCLLEDTKFINDDIIVVRIKDKNIYIQMISIRFMKPNDYKVSITDIPVNKYILEQLKFLTPKIDLIKEPKITTRLNQGVSKSDIKKAKILAKTMDKRANRR